MRVADAIDVERDAADVRGAAVAGALGSAVYDERLEQWSRNCCRRREVPKVRLRLFQPRLRACYCRQQISSST
jgi:hypothetical protein